MSFVLNPDRVPVEVCGLDPGCAPCGRDPGLCCMTPLGCWLRKEGSAGAIEFCGAREGRTGMSIVREGEDLSGVGLGRLLIGRGTSNEFDG